MDKDLSVLLLDIQNRLDKISEMIDGNQWHLLADEFVEIKRIEEIIRQNTQGSGEKISKETIQLYEKVNQQIVDLETRITNWKEAQTKQLADIKKRGNHINGYHKPNARSYYVDKSE